MKEKGRFACKDCIGSVRYINEPRCKKCGKSLENDVREYCYDCENKKHEFIQGRGVFEYGEEMKQSIYKFKYGNKREYADFYIDEMIRNHERWIYSCNPQVLLPVPLYASKKRKRGFNQAEILARKLGRCLDIPVDAKTVVRCKKTIPQKELNEKERKNNMKKAFKISQNAVKLKKVMLVDDIYTTGSTIDEVAKTLKMSGVEEVYYIVVCVGRGY